MADPLARFGSDEGWWGGHGDGDGCAVDWDERGSGWMDGWVGHGVCSSWGFWWVMAWGRGC